MSKVLVIAVHPDDETLGCGGALLKHKFDGDEIHWGIMTSAKSFPGITSEQLKQRQKTILTVEKMYNFNSVVSLDLPTIKLDTLERSVIVDKISSLINEVKPEIIYLPFLYDVHSDHRVIFECAYSCTKSFRYPFIKRVLMMETLSETEFAPSLPGESFSPNVFVDISQFFDKKIKIMKEYTTEIKEHPFPRSIESIKGLAIYRGSAAGCKYAESFMLLKEII